MAPLSDVTIVTDDTRHVGLVAVEKPSSTVLVLLRQTRGKWEAVELRAVVGPLPGRARLARTLDEWTPPKAQGRLTLHDVRSVRISDVMDELARHYREAAQDRIDFPDALITLQKGSGSRFGFRRSTDLRAAIERLHAAVLYVNHVDAGDASPAVAVAEDLGISTVKARALLNLARRDGYLSSTAPGIAGGEILRRGRELIEALTVAATLEGDEQ